ncbi:eosinophil peroxidase-like [Sparus aurata]|uniref:Eosinophil peroxidase-like n=1 Tax=Sparus aurata TaxID=8175 RepID=A0A671V297_SPAAU|nr:eosinophil peroxidase-like [Sparus aurata]XP_030273221.1 eosinophil peroxidase-like [Sparus aurata]
MNGFLCLLAAGLYLCSQCQVTAESRLSRSVIERAVMAAKANVDSAYTYSRRESLDRVRRNALNPAHVLRLLKQPAGVSRTAVRAADYMENAVILVKRSLERRQRRSVNATDLLSEEDLELISELTGCSAQRRAPSCSTLLSIDTFRTAGSTCNNEQNTRWGASNTPFARWLPAEYQDNIAQAIGWDPEKKINGHILPLVREVSNKILRTANSDVENDPLYTHLVTIFAQWTDHDLTFTPHSPVIKSFSSGIDCDKSCARTEPCFPIEIPRQDPRFGRNSEECMPFFRSAPSCGSGNTGHIFGAATVRQQMNTLTAFIDVGQVYGSDEAKARSLRDLTSDKGLLRVNKEYTDDGREHLPFSEMTTNMCATRANITNDKRAKEVPCFVAGDERTNENIALTSLHTLGLREHNRLARALAKLNPHWNGERIYQETRKIMGGYFQVLTFRDYLLHIVGPDILAKQLATYPGYDEEVDPSISNVFATAAYRFAHLMVQPFIFRLDEQYKEHKKFPSPLLSKAFFAPWRVIFEGGLDPIVRGLVGKPAKLNTQDHMMPDELREKLFKFTMDLALDLGALNMQRGRDHGLPGYNKWRKFCGLSEPQNLEQLAEVMNNTDLAKNLLDLYGTPENIDVWLAGVAEPFVPGGRVGPLFACLIATQFQKIRQGDRLWWEKEGVFTEAQRKSLKETSFARIICDNTGVTEVPEKPFQFRPRGSGYTQCKDIPPFDLNPWRDDGRVSRSAPSSSTPKVAFSMRLGNNFPPAGKPIPFRVAIYNDQNSYDVKKGLFTCEHPGVYEFHFNCAISDKDAGVDLMRNGELVAHSFTSSQKKGHVTASGTAIIKLEKGDEVFLLAKHGANGVLSDSYFSGHLLFSE